MENLSPQELKILSEQSFYDLKNSATDKIYGVLEAVRLSLKEELTPQKYLAPDGVDFQLGQLARGENLKGYPYVFLDYPKFFTKQAMFSFRTQVWFGHHVVFSAFFTGPFFNEYVTNFKNHYKSLAGKDLWISSNKLWAWEKKNYIELTLESEHSAICSIEANEFLKLARFFPLSVLSQAEKLPQEIKTFYRQICPIFLK